MQFIRIITQKHTLTSVLLSLISASVLLSCSSGSSDNQTNSNGYYLPYLGSLNVVDSVNFTQQTISSNEIPAAAILRSFEYDRATDTARNFHDEFVVYVDNNKIWKMDITGDSDLVPRQVSSADLTGYCDGNPYYLHTYPLSVSTVDEAMILYQTAGEDGDCLINADNRRYMVRADYSQTTTPLDITDKVDWISSIRVLLDRANINNGAKDILATNGNTLYRYDRNFENPVALTTFSTQVLFENYRPVRTGGLFARIDDDLFWYDVATQTLSNSLFRHSGEWQSDMHCDSGYCYFPVRENSGDWSIYRVSTNRNSPAELVTLNITNAFQFYIGGLTENYIITFASQDQPLYRELHKIPKTGGTPILIDSSNIRIDLIYINDSNVFYNKLAEETTNSGSPITTKTATIIDENNRILRQYTNAEWIGGQYQALGKETSISKLLLSNEYSDEGDNSGAILQAFDINLNQTTTTLGALPEGARGVVTNYGLGNSILIYVLFFEQIDPGSIRMYLEIFGLDFNRENSLTRITNSPNRDKFLIY